MGKISRFNRAKREIFVTGAIALSGFLSGTNPAQANTPLHPRQQESTIYFVKQDSVKANSSAEKQTETPLSWHTLNSRSQQGNRDRGGGRGDRLCMITPADAGYTIWRNQPVFVWQGVIQQLQLETPGGTWEPPITPATQMVVYPQTLPPGRYRYEVTYEDEGTSHTESFSFLVVGAARRDAITAGLTNLESELQAAGASAEEIALHRADYFLSQDLLSDYIQELYSQQNSSPDRHRAAQEIMENFCSSKEN